MRKVANALLMAGTMSAEEAIAIDRPLTPGRLNRKMAIGVEDRWNFERDRETGRYGRLAVQGGR
jgi:hypothetical protein